MQKTDSQLSEGGCWELGEKCEWIKQKKKQTPKPS